MFDARLSGLQGIAIFFAPFIAMAAVFAASYVVTLRQVDANRSHIQLLTADSLSSVELVARIGRDIDRMELLVAQHILTDDAAEKKTAEDQIAAVVADYREAARAYEPVATLPGEADLWEKLKANVRALRPPVSRTLDLSRANRGDEARRMLQALRGPFAAVDADAADLTAINRRGADDTVKRVLAQEGATAVLLRRLGIVGMALSVCIGAVSAGATAVLQRRRFELALHAEALAQRTRDLDAFAGRVAHDLRGPLSTLALAASQVARHATGDSKMVSVLQKSVTRMDAMVGDLLSLARIGESPRDAVSDPALVATQLEEGLGPQAQEEQVAIRVDVQPARVRCVESFLRQILVNLADNAIKYKRPGVAARVEVVGRRRGDKYELSVSDNGEGMSESDAERTFEPFFRATRTRDRPGTGLGLAIVKRVVEASGGTLAVESRLGQGTTFRAELPLANE